MTEAAKYHWKNLQSTAYTRKEWKWWLQQICTWDAVSIQVKTHLGETVKYCIGKVRTEWLLIKALDSFMCTILRPWNKLSYFMLYCRQNTNYALHPSKSVTSYRPHALNSNMKPFNSIWSSVYTLLPVLKLKNIYTIAISIKNESSLWYRLMPYT